MVKVELRPREIQLIHYLAGLSTGKLCEYERGAKILENEVFPLLRKLNRAQQK